MWRKTFREHEININGKKPSDVDDKLEIDCMIKIPGKPVINPINYIQHKVFESPDVQKYKKIGDHPF